MGRREQPGIIYRVVEGDTMFSSQLTQCEIQQLGVKTLGGGGGAQDQGELGRRAEVVVSQGGKPRGRQKSIREKPRGTEVSQREKMMGQKSSRKKP